MPKSAAYEIKLGGDERAELEHRAACYTLSFRQVRRARLMLYAAEDHTNREIAQRLDYERGGRGSLEAALPRRAPRGA